MHWSAAVAWSNLQPPRVIIVWMHPSIIIVVQLAQGTHLELDPCRPVHIDFYWLYEFTFIWPWLEQWMKACMDEQAAKCEALTNLVVDSRFLCRESEPDNRTSSHTKTASVNIHSTTYNSLVAL
jgi:hypothetical protein